MILRKIDQKSNSAVHEDLFFETVYYIVGKQFSFATATTANIDAPTVIGLFTKTDSTDQPDVEQISLDPFAQRARPHASTQSSQSQTSTTAVNTVASPPSQ